MESWKTASKAYFEDEKEDLTIHKWITAVCDAISPSVFLVESSTAWYERFTSHAYVCKQSGNHIKGRQIDDFLKEASKAAFDVWYEHVKDIQDVTNASKNAFLGVVRGVGLAADQMSVIESPIARRTWNRLCKKRISSNTAEAASSNDVGVDMDREPPRRIDQ